MLTEKPCTPTGVTHSDSGNEPKMIANNPVCRTYGNTIIRINEHFPEKGRSAAELIERTIRYEQKKTNRT